MNSGRDSKSPYRDRGRAFAKHVSPDDRKFIGKYIAERRVAASMSQGDLARRLDLPQSVLSKIEKGHREVALLEFAAICAELQLDAPSELNRILDALPSRTAKQ